MNDKKMKRISAISHGVFLAVLAALLAVTALYDLEINQALENQNSFFGALFARIGEYPSYLITPVCAVILLYNFEWINNRKGRAAWKVFWCAICLVGVIIFAMNTVDSSRPTAHQWGFTIVYSLGIAALMCYCAQFIDRELMHKLAKFAVFALTVLVVSLIIINVTKIFWGRMRYREMLKVGSFDGFTRWYIPQGIAASDEFKSFPSGHTASAANIFVLMVLCDIFPKWKNKKILVCVLCLLFTIATGLARVVYTAHFLSDTLVGGSVSYGVYYACKKLFFKDGKYIWAYKEKGELNEQQEV